MTEVKTKVEPQGPRREVYAGPFTLEEALDICGWSGCLRMAISVPEGTFVAVEVSGEALRHQRTLIRRVPSMSGQGGSVMVRDGIPQGGSIDPNDPFVQSLRWRPL